MGAQNRTDIHRYLDDVFAGVALTPDLQDLKEELRGSLMARVSELQASGAVPSAAAATAIDELGDVRALIAEVSEVQQDASGRSTAFTGSQPTSAGDGPQRVRSDRAPGTPGTASYQSMLAEFRRNRVRPKPAFVVRTVLLSLVLAAATALTVLGGLGLLSWPLGVVIAIAVVAGALPLGVIVADSVQQETTHNYPLPASRAARFGIASGLGYTALALLGIFAARLDQVWLPIVGVPLGIVSLLLFVWLGVTKTNRKKQWIVAAQSEWEWAGHDRFSEDPVAAARFGIYTVIIWILAFAAFIVLSFTVGFGWSWIALLLGFALFMFVLARMLFPVSRMTPTDSKDDTHE